MGNGVSKPQTTASASKDVKQQSMTERGSEEYPTNSTAMQGSEEDFDIVCVPCHRDGTRLEALGYCCQCQEHLCGQCCQTHKKATPSRHHNILDKESMPTTQQIDDYTLDRHTDTITKPCLRHKNEMLKLYCQTHSVLLCSKCVALAHTKSCKVAYIPDISEQMIGSKEYEQTVERMETLLTECTRIKKTTDADTSASNKSLDKVLKDLKQYRREMNEHFDKMEKATEHEIHTLKQQNVQRKNEADAKCDDAMKTVQSAAKILNELNASKQSDMLFVELKQTQEQLKEHEKTIHYHTTNNQIDEFVFVRSTSIDDALLQNKIGDIKTKNPRQQDQVKIQTLRTKQQAKEDAVSQTPSHTQDPNSQAKAKSTSPQTQHEDNAETKHQAKCKTAGTFSQNPASTAVYDNITPTYQGKLCVKTKEDNEDCWITGLTILSKDKLVLADHNNESVKLVDVNNNIVTSHLTLTGTPWDITSTSSTQVAVTLPYKPQIQFINVTDQLSCLTQYK